MANRDQRDFERIILSGLHGIKLSVLGVRAIPAKFKSSTLSVVTEGRSEVKGRMSDVGRSNCNAQVSLKQEQVINRTIEQ